MITYSTAQQLSNSSKPDVCDQAVLKQSQKRSLSHEDTVQLKMAKLSCQSPSQCPVSSISIQKLTIRSPSEKLNWEERAFVVPTNDLIGQILKYESSSNEKIERLLCGVAKQLHNYKAKPDSILILSLIYIGKIRPHIFRSDIVVDAFSSLLKREALSMHAKMKNSQVPVMVINLFQKAFQDESSWPEVFLKLYVEDALNERVWVDHEECKVSPVMLQLCPLLLDFNLTPFSGFCRHHRRLLQDKAPSKVPTAGI